jgi:undecaprenyl diphosphate synthase
LIPDGNRRWARAHKLSILEGYDLGVKKFLEFSEWCMSYGINNITVWALSSENIKRSTNEVKVLFNIYRRVCRDKKIIGRIQSEGVRLNIISNKKLLPKDLSKAPADLERRTMKNTGGVINLLIGYGGKDDLIFAAKRAAGMIRKGFDMDADAFTKCLLSNRVPEIDFIIRTSGEKRLSGFMPWQTSYSELYFSDKLWPDFSKEDLHSALSEYESRDRRFGK